MLTSMRQLERLLLVATLLLGKAPLGQVVTNTLAKPIRHHWIGTRRHQQRYAPGDWGK